MSTTHKKLLVVAGYKTRGKTLNHTVKNHMIDNNIMGWDGTVDGAKAIVLGDRYKADVIFEVFALTKIA